MRPSKFMATGTLHDCCRAGSASRSYVLPRLFQQKFATRYPGTIYMVLLFRWPPILEMWHFISANICVTARSTYPDYTLGCELVGSKQETWVDHHTISPLSRPCRHDFQALGLSVNLSEDPDFAKSNCLWCTCVAMSLLLILWTKVSENNPDNSATLMLLIYKFTSLWHPTNRGQQRHPSSPAAHPSTLLRSKGGRNRLSCAAIPRSFLAQRPVPEKVL